MSNLAHRQSVIQEKRKSTPWRKFILELTPWICFGLYKGAKGICRYPETERLGEIMKEKDYREQFPQGTPGIDFDSNKSFFDQFHKFFLSTPKCIKTTYGTNENCDFSEVVFGAKDSYLSFIIGGGGERLMYSIMVYDNVADVYNSVSVIKSQNIYYSKSITESFNIFYSKFIHNSNNLWFCSNCTGCTECILCDKFVNQSYCINNKQLSKEEYIIQKQKILLQKNDFDNYLQSVSKEAENTSSTNSTGKNIKFSSDINNGVNVYQVENARNAICVDFGTNYYDVFDAGMTSHHLYGVSGAGQGCEHIYCCVNQGGCSHCFYSYFLQSCSFCLGCIGLKNKSYCILNKQYTKEERYSKVDEIFGQMKQDGTLGDFFPATMNPFYFNDTAAYLIDPSFTKEEVTTAGYLRRDEPIKVDIPEGALVVKISELTRFESFDSNGNWKIDPEVLKYIIVDGQSNVYRIVKMEYDFLLKYGLPLPRKHWLDRMRENFRIG